MNADPIVAETVKNLYDGVPMSQVYDSAILAARTMIEKDPAYSQVTARILLHTIRREILEEEVTQARNGRALRRVLPAVHQARRASRTARRKAASSST